MKRATALLKNGKVYLQAYSKTTAGVWIAHGPVYVAPVEQLDQIGSNARAALALSRHDVNHPGPTEWKAVQQPMLDAVGARSWAVLAKGSRVVGLVSEGTDVTMVPSENYANNGGTALQDKARKVLLSDAGFGRVLLEALEISS